MTHMEFAHPYFGAFMFIVTFGAFGANCMASKICK